MNSPAMTLRFLGTAAAESYPAPFCTCVNCQVARRHGGRDIRRRSALLVNDDLLIDFGPDVFQSFQAWNLNAANLRTLLVTHGHADHLAADNLGYRRPGFRKCTELPPLAVYGPGDAMDIVLNLMGPYLEEAGLRVIPIEAGDEIEAEDYTIRALPAAHGGESHECLLYLVERQGRRFLYGTDTGPFPEAAWEALREYPPNLAILDGTMGTLSAGSHMGMAQVAETAAELRKITGEGIEIIAHHFSHQANPAHEELTRIYGADGIRVSYDEMAVDL